MPRPEKVAAIEELKQNIEGNAVAILTRYQGIDVANVTELRARLRSENVTYKVYKNTLARRALDELDLGDAVQYMEGPTAWAFSDDPVAPAKIIKEFAKAEEHVGMQGGILRGNIIDAEMLGRIADLPSRDELIAQTVGTIAMPLRKFLGTLNALPRNFLYALVQIRDQKEQAGETA